jgi:WD40 repeat protein
VSGYDYAVYVLNIERGQQEMRFELDGFAPSVQFTPCGTMLGVASWDNSARMFSLDRREVSRLIHDHRKRYDGPDDISDMNNWSWPFDGGEPRFDNKVYRALFSADGKYLLTASAEGCVRVWECLSAEERVDLRRPGQAGTFSGDGQTLFVTNYRDGTLGAYRLNDGHEIFNVRIAQSLSSPEIAGKGEFIVMLAGSEAIIVEAETGKLVSRCQHDEDIRASSLSKDGYFLATGSTDRTVRVWDIPSGAEQVRVPLDSAVGDVDFRVDGGWLAVATEAAHLMLWRTNDLVAEAKNYVSRNLSPREWERFFGDVPYRKTLLNRP